MPFAQLRRHFCDLPAWRGEARRPGAKIGIWCGYRLCCHRSCIYSSPSAVSPNVTRRFKFKSQDMIGRSFADFCHADDRKTLARAIASALAGEHHVLCSHRAMTSEMGTFVWCETAGAFCCDDQGSMLSCLTWLTHIPHFRVQRRHVLLLCVPRHPRAQGCRADAARVHDRDVARPCVLSFPDRAHRSPITAAYALCPLGRRLAPQCESQPTPSCRLPHCSTTVPA